ncbi:signal peptide peptidase [Grosmannia clavigera kw1407]|uniref:Signal peptide peptidase n=1 Tax=Grosmannia clavigera (strain kw1407 / UAMH 11150) TaxID=655863 RepID=F0XJ20_GROCL|nr:signal peptide peptidase [Grosmannia clavigera kw1407]EFX02434.1 signal peptide peptidase [Grosmannia clavigera kw1407]
MSSSIPELVLNGSQTNTSLVNGTIDTSVPYAVLANTSSIALPDSTVWSFLGLAYDQRHYLLVQGRLFALTLTIIYISAHSALHRPNSAAPRRDEAEDDASSDKTKRGIRRRRRRRSTTSDSKEGIQVHEAILIPFVAGAALVGMYYLLQYLDDPKLLSRILRTYSSVVGVASLGKLLGDGLHSMTSLVFPNVWARWDPTGQQEVFRIDPTRRCQLRQQVRQQEPAPGGESPDGWTVDTIRISPFPDRLAWLARTPAATAQAWTLRRLMREQWTVRVAMAGFGNAELDVTLSTLVGIYVSAGLVAAYCFTSAASSHTLNNLLGLGFCYGSLMLVSCTSFGIGSIVLVGLFVYDIVMVFYTPFMVTVAMNVDAPIKLVASSGTRSSILGLGDIVVPGIFVCMCLRYDLHRFYARQIQRVPTTLVTETVAEDGAAVSTATATKDREVKASFIEPKGRWGDRLWTMGLWGTLSSSLPLTPGLRAAAFPKPLFHTAMVAYFVGLLVAVSIMLYTRRGQPALLYLVPAVLLATWGRALATGELKQMWAYTEDESADVKEVVVELGPDGKPTKKAEEETPIEATSADLEVI